MILQSSNQLLGDSRYFIMFHRSKLSEVQLDGNLKRSYFVVLCSL